MPSQHQAPWELLDSFAARVGFRLCEAEAHEDWPEVARLTAMREALEARAIPLICPDAVIIAGDAARAAHQGRAEPEWYASAYQRFGGSGEFRAELNRAIRLLRSAGLWPWEGQRRGAAGE